ncbi:hypothetical protein [Viridibacillus arvi]|uniref:hypothetical protein n=1 Tax=Viridibacillus arvi TaxID=263475 RepID=UPI0034CE8B6E
MSTNNLISFYDKKVKKDQENKEKLYDMIIDFYIPYSEIPFWIKVIKFFPMVNIEAFAGDEQKIAEVKEFYDTFTTDIEMYEDFGQTLEKFRFLFSYFELFVLHKVLVQIKISNYDNSEELAHYLSLLQEQLNKNTDLAKLF